MGCAVYELIIESATTIVPFPRGPSRHGDHTHHIEVLPIQVPGQALMAPALLPLGTVGELHGLESAKEENGKKGTIVSTDPQTGRYGIRCEDGTQLAVLGKNFMPELT